MTDYYVDSVGGNDANTGLSPAQRWENLTMLYTVSLSPGDQIYLYEDSDWDFTSISSSGFVISASGTAANPIVFQSYDTSGAQPIIRNNHTYLSWCTCVTINGDYIQLVDINLLDASEAGVLIANGADHNKLDGLDISNTGCGVLLNGGDYNWVYNCNIHDLVMTMNDSYPTDNDYGATGVIVQNGSSYNEISYCTFTDCIAPSYDYGMDGGIVELFGPNTNYNEIHHNLVDTAEIFTEVTYTQTGNRFYQNVARNLHGSFCGFQMWSGTITSFVFEHNTIVCDDSAEQLILFWSGTPNSSTVNFRNNILWSYDQPITNADGFAHTYNLYYRVSGSALGLSLGTGEQNTNPLFIDQAGGDYHLQTGSPAKDAGTDLGYTIDFDDNSMPVGAAPDMGAYEVQAVSGGACIVISINVQTATQTVVDVN